MKTTIITFLSLFIFCSSLCGQNLKDSLLVFIGEKIEVKYSPEEKKEKLVLRIKGNDSVYVKQHSISMDSRYIAKYKVVKLLNGSFNNDIIEFEVFDHYGEPRFSKFNTVLLFVSKHNGKLYHEKYQYFDLYKTKDGMWASPYSSSDYNHPSKENITVKPEKISFQNEISFVVDKLTNDELKIWYPSPYFEVKDGRAIAKYGNYIDDLFKLKQQTILKARGIY